MHGVSTLFYFLYLSLLIVARRIGHLVSLLVSETSIGYIHPDEIDLILMKNCEFYCVLWFCLLCSLASNC